MNYTCFFGTLDFGLPEYRSVALTFYAITAIPAIVLNSLVLYCIWKTPVLYKPSYLLLASLAFSDLLNASLGQYLMVLTNIAALNGLSTAIFCFSWIGGRAISYWLASVSLYTLAIISIDRLLAIKKKTRYRTIVTMRRITIIIVEYWVKSFVLILVFLLNFNIKKNLNIYLSILGCSIFVMLSTITISYSLAYYYLKKTTNSVTPNNGNSSASNADINVAKYRKSLNTMILVYLVLILFYFPYVTSAITAAFYITLDVDFDRKMSDLFYQIIATCELVAFLNSGVNPLMYLWRMRDIRQAVFTVVRKFFRRKKLDNREPKTN